MSDIAWFVPALIEGSGGHRTILQHAHALETSGHRCFLYLEGRGNDRHARKTVERLFGYRFERAWYGWDNVKQADMVIATIWYSAALVRNLPFSCIKAYLIQDYEALFNPMGDTYLMAENSYRYGLMPITVGRWLGHVLGTRFQVASYNLDFGADTKIYRPLLNAKREHAVCFVYQPDKPRRCVWLGIQALSIVKHLEPEVKIYLYGSPVKEAGCIGFEHEHLGLLSLEECNSLYNRCSAGLCISSSNPSRVPFEMMAAGLPVVDLWRENNLFDFPSDAVSLAEQTPESIAGAILRLLRCSAEREDMSRSGVKFMTSAERMAETGQFVRIVGAIINGKVPNSEPLTAKYDLPPVMAGDFINGLPAEIIRRLTAPPNAAVNSLPPLLQRFARWGVRKVRRLLLDRP